MIARAIHAHGPSTAPFVQVDCSAPVPEEVELELFGVAIKRAAVGTPERRSLERRCSSSTISTKPPVACCCWNSSRSCPRGHRRGWCGSCAITRYLHWSEKRRRMAIDVRVIASADAWD